MRVACEAPLGSLTWALALGVAPEELRQSVADLARHLLQVHYAPRARGTLHLEIVAVEMVVPLERLDEQVVDRKPHGPAPVGVPAEVLRVHIPRHVFHSVLLAVHTDNVRLALMHSRQGANAVRR